MSSFSAQASSRYSSSPGGTTRSSTVTLTRVGSAATTIIPPSPGSRPRAVEILTWLLAVQSNDDRREPSEAVGVSFELREHTADVAVEAEAETLGGVFAALADGMAAAMADEIPGGGERFALVERAESREAALYDYLGELLYERDVRGVLPVDNDA